MPKKKTKKKITATKGKKVLLAKIKKWAEQLQNELDDSDGYSSRDVHEISIELDMVHLFYSAVKKYG